MHVVFGILLLIAGVAYPLAALAWLNQRMARPPTLTPRQVGLLLAFNGVLPVSLVFWGLGLAVPRLGATLAVQAGAIIASVAALVLLVALWLGRPQNAEPGSASSPDGETTHDG